MYVCVCALGGGGVTGAVCVLGVGGQAIGVGLRRLDERGVQIDRWRRVHNGSVGGIMEERAPGGGGG